MPTSPCILYWFLSFSSSSKHKTVHFTKFLNLKYISLPLACLMLKHFRTSLLNHWFSTGKDLALHPLPTPEQQMALSRVISGCHNWREDATGIWWVDVRDDDQNPIMHRTATRHPNKELFQPKYQ